MNQLSEFNKRSNNTTNQASMLNFCKIFLSFTAVFLFYNISSYGQQINLNLTFSAVDGNNRVKLDSIKVINRMFGGGMATSYWPDTTISFQLMPGDTLLYVGYTTIYPVGKNEADSKAKSFRLFQNSPNPVSGQCQIVLSMPETGLVEIDLYNIYGQRIASNSFMLEQGFQRFRLVPGGNGIMLFTARWKGQIQTVKIISISDDRAKKIQVDYLGNTESVDLKTEIAIADFFQESGILDAPLTSKTYTFQFATNIPCLGIPIVVHGGKTYNTIQIYSQCWLKENLDIGTMIPGTQDMSDNGTIEKYCYDDDTSNCRIYGGLYQRGEAVQYIYEYGPQGICPPGWHIPTDEEWQVLEGAVDTHYFIGDDLWGNHGYRGTDAGANLKTTSGWNNNGNGTNKFDFCGLPAGGRVPGFFFHGLKEDGLLWTSSEDLPLLGYYRLLDNMNNGIHRGPNNPDHGYGIRCVKNNY